MGLPPNYTVDGFQDLIKVGFGDYLRRANHSGAQVGQTSLSIPSLQKLPWCVQTHFMARVYLVFFLIPDIILDS